MSHFSVINLSYLELISGGDKAFQKEIMETFLTYFPGMIQAVADAVEVQNAELLKQAAHKAKSPTKFLGLDDTWLVLHNLEEYAREFQKVPDHAPGTITELNSVCNKAIEDVKLALSKLEF